MKDNYTQIAVILDRSGSMQSVRQSTIDGINEFFGSQKKQPGDADVLFIQFDDEYEVLFDGNLKDVPLLTNETYVPRGWTALNDAIGRTINTIGSKLSSKPEDEKPLIVIVAIMTDGHENRSKEFTKAQVAEMIKHQREKYNWDFVFVGANQDAIFEANRYNIEAKSAITYDANEKGLKNVMRSVTSYVGKRRTSLTARASFTTEDRKNAIVKDDKV